MADLLENLLGLTIAVFMAGSLLEMGLKLDLQKNAQSPADQFISAADSAVPVLIVSTQEDWAIAQECWKLA